MGLHRFFSRDSSAIGKSLSRIGFFSGFIRDFHKLQINYMHMNSRVTKDLDRCSITERAGGQEGWQVTVCGDWSGSGLYVSTRLFLLVNRTRVEITETASTQRFNVMSAAIIPLRVLHAVVR